MEQSGGYLIVEDYSAWATLLTMLDEFFSDVELDIREVKSGKRGKKKHSGWSMSDAESDRWIQVTMISSLHRTLADTKQCFMVVNGVFPGGPGMVDIIRCGVDLANMAREAGMNLIHKFTIDTDTQHVIFIPANDMHEWVETVRSYLYAKSVLES